MRTLGANTQHTTHTDIIEPATAGTRTVLSAAAAAAPRPKRVIVTSSVCAIHDQNQAQVPAAGAGRMYTEQDWNGVSTPEAEPYWVSKVCVLPVA